MTMQHDTSQDQARQRGRPVLIAGIGAAAVAAVLTVVLMSNSTPTATSQQAMSNNRQCQLVPRRSLVSTTNGGGTVRFRASGWVSQPFTLTTQPQAVVFPLPRPEVEPVDEVVTIEGDASDVVVTSDVTEFRRVFARVQGSYDFVMHWKPMKRC